jgi:5-formyltetrahydrofolate cyclo-ligase
MRQRLIQRRLELSPAQSTMAAERVASRLAGLLSTANRIGVYLAGKGELSLAPLISQHPQASLFAPRVVGKHVMQFAQCQPGTMLAKNRFGLPEPPPHAPSCAIADLEYLLMPLVGFDARGARLGMGGGFYDRALAELKNATWPRRIGIAFDCQRVPKLDEQPWDVGCHAIVTPSGWYHSALPETDLPTEDAPWPVG